MRLYSKCTRPSTPLITCLEVKFPLSVFYCLRTQWLQQVRLLNGSLTLKLRIYDGLHFRLGCLMVIEFLIFHKLIIERAKVVMLQKFQVSSCESNMGLMAGYLLQFDVPAWSQFVLGVAKYRARLLKMYGGVSFRFLYLWIPLWWFVTNVF